MKNFNFAFFLALYFAINGWVYLKAPREYLFMSVVLTLPLIFFAISGLERNKKAAQSTGNEEAERLRKVNLLEESIAAYISSILTLGVFIAFAYRRTTHADSAGIGFFFFLPRLEGWGYFDGLLMLIFGSSLASCGIAVWAAQYKQQLFSKPPSDTSARRLIFLLDAPPATRLVAYFLFVLIPYAAGLAAVLPLHPSLKWFGLLIIGGRCTIPLMLLLVAAFIRLPMLPFAVLAMGGTMWLFWVNTGRILDCAVFLVVQFLIHAAHVFLAIRIAKNRAEKPDAPLPPLDGASTENQ